MLPIARSVWAAYVADADRLPSIQVLPDLPAQIDRVAGYHRLAEIIVEVLLRIRLAGVEWPDAAVGGHQEAPTRLDGSGRSWGSKGDAAEGPFELLGETPGRRRRRSFGLGCRTLRLADLPVVRSTRSDNPADSRTIRIGSAKSKLR